MTNFASQFKPAADDSPEMALMTKLLALINAEPPDTACTLNCLFSLYRHIVLQHPQQQAAAVMACGSFAGELMTLANAGLGNATPANTVPC